MGRPNSTQRAILALFSATILLGAVLTFLIQPFLAKAILPLFGGTPSVWNTCVLFFQAGLLASYAYAHLLTRTRRSGRARLMHLGLLAAVLVLLPIRIGPGWAPPEEAVPVLWQLRLLLATAGTPFFVVAATSPLVQRWFSASGHPAARDPYFLYASSNLGSLVALVAYPFLLEPAFDLSRIGQIWTAGYLALAVLVGACAAATWKQAPLALPPPDASARPLPAASRLRWFALASVPASLMLSVTTHLGTNVAASPLLWILPLGIYLGTYILAFSRRSLVPTRRLERLLPLIALMLVATLLARDLELPPWALFPLHLGGLSIIALACHGQLAELRPPVSRLTEYYLWIAVGGLAGGVFNVLVAPAVFTGIVEYPAVIVLACLMRRAPGPAAGQGWDGARSFVVKDALPAAALGLVTLGLTEVAPRLGLGNGREAALLTIAAPASACYLLLMRPLRFALALAALLAAGSWGASLQSDVLFRARTYYGLHEVRRNAGRLELYHGRTLHGMQNPDSRTEPLAYYLRASPAGSLFRALEARPPTRVGVVGLGVGALAAYSRPGQQWTFYELDPTIVELATRSGYFNYLRDARAELRVVVGDARSSLERESGASFDLLILDAFSSDAVPTHLLTREALELYRRRLTPAGTLAVHVSNRFLDLEGVIASLARDAGLEAFSWADLEVSVAERAAGHLPSHWIVVGHATDLAAVGLASGTWRRLTDTAAPVWTDQYSNPLGIVRWVP